MKLKGLYDNNKTLILGIMTVLAIVVIVLGSLASWDISKEFNTSSETYGKPVITHLEGDLYDIALNEDESVFLSYTVTSLSFAHETSYTWSDIKTLEKLNYRPKECDYALYINGIKIQTNKLERSIDCPVALNFRNPDESITTVEFQLIVRFYTERTDLLILFQGVKGDRYIGYLNAMVDKGFNVRIIEKPISEKFTNAGDVKDPSLPSNTFIYNFNPAELEWNNDMSYLASAPYYVYSDYAETDDSTAMMISPLATATRRNYFYGVIYHDGFTSAPPLTGGTSSNITMVTPTIEISGLVLGGSYNAYIGFNDNPGKTIVMSYWKKDKFSSSATLTAIPGIKSEAESTYYCKFIDTYTKEPSLNAEGGINTNCKGAFEHTVTTQYGKYDVLINPCFSTTDGSNWVFSCGIYLKNPLNTKMDSTTIAAVVEAIRTQLNFTLTINY